MVEKEITIAKDYYAREDGAIISKKHGGYKEISQHLNKKNRYYSVRVGIAINKPKTFNVHRLIAMAFIGVCPEGMEVRHLDGDSCNNKAENLSYGTRLENHSDKIRHGTSGKGADNSMAKLTEEDVLAIRAKYKKGVYGYMRVAREFNVLSGTIQKIINREIWKHI